MDYVWAIKFILLHEDEFSGSKGIRSGGHSATFSMLLQTVPATFAEPLGNPRDTKPPHSSCPAGTHSQNTLRVMAINALISHHPGESLAL